MGGRLAVRPTRVRRLRIHRAIRGSTLGVGLLLVAGAFYVATQKQVMLVVHGSPQAINTTSESVRELLVGEGISLTSSLRVVPPPATELADGMTVVVSPAPGAPPASLFAGGAVLGLGFDHQVDQGAQGSHDVGVWVVDGASSGPVVRIAAELAEASASVVRVGTSPVVPVRVVVSGKVHDVLTNAATSGELLSAMGIAPDADDRVQPPPSTPLHVGALVALDRVRTVTRTTPRTIRFATRTTYSSRLAPGVVRVTTVGKRGLGFVTERIVFVNGRLDSRTVVDEDVLRAPVDEVRVSGPAPADGGSKTTPAGTRDQAGEATWYDPPWSGSTAAHPWLRFGTRVRVTDLLSGRSVVVVINDRGPFSPGRIIDLSPEAFSALAPLGRGVLDVRISW
jgi:uncharacterized protein YabE (DUF348 family)